jgi:hypothetical protein
MPPDLPLIVSGTDGPLLAPWRFVSDGVMGGVSTGALDRAEVDGRRCLRLTGTLSLENRGGFIQMARDLAPDGGLVDARAWSGVALLVRGDGGRYGVHLRDAATRRPWQSHRAAFDAPSAWTALFLPFAGFVPHDLVAPLDPTTLRRIGIIALGRAGPVDLAVAEVALRG